MSDVPNRENRETNLVLSRTQARGAALDEGGILYLNDLAPGETAMVQRLDGGGDFRSRMAALGFTPGALVRMVQNYGHGALIVSVRGVRVALGRGEACKVVVTRRSDQA